MNVYENVKITTQILDGAADNEAFNGVGVDMTGYEGVAFFAVIGEGEVITCTLKAQQDSDSAYGTAADLAGSALDVSPTVGAKGEGVLDIYRPAERYVRPVLTVGNFTTPTAVTVIAMQYGAHDVPVGNTGEFHLSPAEGTA